MTQPLHEHVDGADDRAYLRTVMQRAAARLHDEQKVALSASQIVRAQRRIDQLEAIWRDLVAPGDQPTGWLKHLRDPAVPR